MLPMTLLSQLAEPRAENKPSWIRTEGVVDGSPATTSFLEALRRLPEGSLAAAFDIGANDGSFSNSLAKQVAKQAPHVKLALHIFEPQPQFAPRLQAIAQRKRGGNINCTFHPAVAGHREGNMTLFLSKQSQAASTLRSQARRFGVKSALVVRSVNLAELIIAQVRALQVPPKRRPAATAAAVAAVAAAATQQPPILLKMDIEGAEFSLLPHLLMAGALCSVTHLRTEWHLNSQPEAQRMSGVALRLGLHNILTQGCPHVLWRQRQHAATADGGGGGGSGGSGSGGGGDGEAPLDYVVEDEEYRPINFGEPVPGMMEEAARHVTSKDVTALPNSTGQDVSLRGTLLHGTMPLGIDYAFDVHKDRRVKGRTLFTTTSAAGREQSNDVPKG